MIVIEYLQVTSYIHAYGVRACVRAHRTDLRRDSHADLRNWAYGTFDRTFDETFDGTFGGTFDVVRHGLACRVVVDKSTDC